MAPGRTGSRGLSSQAARGGLGTWEQRPKEGSARGRDGGGRPGAARRRAC